jgi:glycerol-3-phosphate O-acyltransferase
VEGPRTYEPNPALAWLYERFFSNIEVDASWAARVREADARGTVVYVLRNLSFVDFLALDHLTKRLALPQVRFANDLGLWLLEPLGRGWLSALRPRGPTDDVQRLRLAIDGGHSAALFLKRPPSLLEPAPVAWTRDGARASRRPARGKTEGDAFLRAVLAAQRARTSPILLVPQVFVWTRTPDDAEHNVVDALFGPREWPGNLRTATQFLMNWRHVTLRAGEPLDVSAFLAQVEGEGAQIDDDALVRRLTYALLRRLERERRGVLGPTRKPADRLRDQVVRSPRLARVIRDMAGEGAEQRRVLGYRALSMLKEMEAEVEMSAVRALDTAFDATVARMYSGIEIDDDGLARVREATKDGTLVLLPSHKSHVDYIVLTRLFFRSNMPVPLVAAGDNLAFFPLGPVLRRAGAFFIRRSFKGDRLYAAVVDAYMRRLLKDGYPLEFFLEGARSRTGKLLPPKLGLLSIVVDAALGSEGDGGRQVKFVPISIGYERVVEERAYVRELTGGDKSKEDVRGLLGAATSALGRYGRLNVQFGEVLTLDDVVAEMSLEPTSQPAPAQRNSPARANLSPARRRALVSRLAYRVMNEINRVTAVTPGALVAAALLTHGQRGIAHADLVAVCKRLATTLAREGARFTPSLRDGDELRVSAIREALELFARAGHVEAHRPGVPVGEDKGKARPGPDAVYVVPEDARLSLDIAKNLLVHFFVSRATIATPLVARGAEAGLPREELRERVRALSRLLKFEFQFRADATFEAIFDETLGAMREDGDVAEMDGIVSLGHGDGRGRAVVHARMIAAFVEGYRVAARALAALLKGPLAAKDLAKRALAVGERMFLAGEIAHREAVSRPVVENALLAFVDQGCVVRASGKLALPESFASVEAAATIEARIAAFMP